MNYQIVGADQKEYGPVTSEQLRQWIAQGRANAGTVAQVEGSTEWKQLASFPEFTSMFSSVPPLVTPPFTGESDFRKSRLAAGLFGIFLGGLGVHRFYLGYTAIGVAQIGVTILVTLATCGVGWILGWIWGFIEGILILTNSGITADAEGRPLKG